jgi:hypothetical protein
MDKIPKIILVCVIILTSSLTGFYYQTQTDTVFPTYIFGFYNSGANALPISYGGFSFIGDFLNYLSNHFKAEYLYDGFQFFMIMSLLVVMLFHYLSKLSPLSFSKLIFLLLIITLLGEFYRPLEVTKTSFFICFSSIVAFNKKKYLLLKYVLFTIAFLIRPEPAILAFVLSVIYDFTIRFQQGIVSSLIFSIYHNFGRIIIIVILSFLINLNYTEEDRAYKKIRPFENTLSDFNRSYPSSTNLTHKDSIKIEAAINFFYGDAKILNPEYFSAIGVIKRDKTPISIIQNLFKFRTNYFIKSSFISVLIKSKYHFLLIFLLAIFCLYNQLYKALYFLTTTTLLVLFISFFMKSELHVITPSIAIISLLTLEQCIVANKKSRRLIFSNLLSGLLIVTIISILKFQIDLVSLSKLKHEYYSTILQDIESIKDNNSKIVLNISVWDEFHYKLFSKIQPLNFKNIVVVDGGILYLNKEYQNKMRQITSEKTFEKQFFKILFDEKLHIYSSKKRMKLIKKYSYTIYGIHFDLNHVMSFGYFEHADTDNFIYIYEL